MLLDLLDLGVDKRNDLFDAAFDDNGVSMIGCATRYIRETPKRFKLKFGETVLEVLDELVN